MPRMAQFVLALLVGLALAWAVSGVVQTTVREWFERDINARSRLLLLSAQQSIANASLNPVDLQNQLRSLASDERVMGVSVCDADLNVRASTKGFPEDFGCFVVGSRARTENRDDLEEWSTVATLPSGRVHVSVIPLRQEVYQLGFVILLHDLSYIDHREAQARTFLMVGFGILAVMAFGVPMFVAKWAQYGWSAELRRLLRNGSEQNREFQPILSDVRELVSRMANEREDAPGQWTPERLKQTLNRHLHGEKIVIVANREPYVHQYTAEGQIESSASCKRFGDSFRAGDARLLGSVDCSWVGIGGPG